MKRYNYRRSCIWGRRKKDRVKSYWHFNQSDLNALIKNTKISTVIGDYVPLKLLKSGHHVGRCPLCRTFTHNEAHLHINDNKKRFKCFECGFGGTSPIGFLMAYHKIGFDDSIRYLNKKYHENKFELRTEGIVVSKGSANIGEDLPF
jgi:DNA primase